MLITFFEQKQINSKLTLILRLNDSKSLETSKHHSSFAGMHVTQSENMHRFDQGSYMSKTETIPSNAEFRKFASLRMKLAWLANTKPAIIFEISKIAQVAQLCMKRI